ncbi:MAG: phosphoribosylglycinamide formyltransferase, partial [Candidatus Lokiarchaeota archaeon]|nr:phosphoribosylglycinamide formyltransferase [Candidatus Lokiarchaeota archaeon]MBD3198727.1 phosphoribosylglycinamide formyltransferase [Candidatus Lokiarchaeota archaeon]
MKNIGCVASGSGSNFEAIVEATESGILKGKADVKVLICNKAGAYCMERAENHGIPYVLIESDKHKGTREEFDQKMIDVLKNYECEIITLVGYMRLVSKTFIKAFSGSVMNIHPALLPSFKGMHAHKDALEYGVKVSGATVHFVDEHEDHGPIIIQKCVPVYAEDTEETLGKRIIVWEHKIFPKAIELYCDNRLQIKGRIVHIDGQ